MFPGLSSSVTKLLLNMEIPVPLFLIIVFLLNLAYELYITTPLFEHPIMVFPVKAKFWLFPEFLICMPSTQLVITLLFNSKRVTLCKRIAALDMPRDGPFVGYSKGRQSVNVQSFTNAAVEGRLCPLGMPITEKLPTTSPDLLKIDSYIETLL